MVPIEDTCHPFTDGLGSVPLANLASHGDDLLHSDKPAQFLAISPARLPRAFLRAQDMLSLWASCLRDH